LISRKLLILILPLWGLLSCGNSNNHNSEEILNLESQEEISRDQYFRVKAPKECDISSQNRFVYDVMHDSYLWANQVKKVDYLDSNYTSPDLLLHDLKVEKDHFSFIIQEEEATRYFEEGENDNFGFSIKLVALDSINYGLIVSFIYPNSPADQAGFKRGDLIRSINQQNITQENIQEIAQLLEEERQISFGVADIDTGIILKEVTLTKETYPIQTILYSNIDEQLLADKKIGYMVFQDFIDSAIPEIDQLFSQFKTAGVNELILDLRYNGGGSVDVARHLSSLIGGDHVWNNVFHHVNLNERYSKYNFTSYFEAYDPNALNLSRVFILTTRASCSASELVINALRASINNIEVIQIGEATCGKPYGFIGAGLFCDKALYAINMETKNSDNVGDYVDGIFPKCQAKDNILKDFGDPQEDLLSAARFYLKEDRCPQVNTQTKQQPSREIQDLPTSSPFKRLMVAF